MNLLRLRRPMLAACFATSALLSLQACSGDSETPEPGGEGASSSGGQAQSSSSGEASSSGQANGSSGGGASSGQVNGSSSGEASSSGGASGSSSGDPDAGPEPGGGESLCEGVPEFGANTVSFTTGVQAIPAAVGGVIPSGTYDAVAANRTSNSGGSWRETLVIGDSASDTLTFTRRRQIRVSADSAPGPISDRQGTFSINGTSIFFNATCGTRDGVLLDGPDSTSHPYSVVLPAGGPPELHIIASGIQVILRRRD